VSQISQARYNGSAIRRPSSAVPTYRQVLPARYRPVTRVSHGRSNAPTACDNMSQFATSVIWRHALLRRVISRCDGRGEICDSPCACSILGSHLGASPVFKLQKFPVKHAKLRDPLIHFVLVRLHVASDLGQYFWSLTPGQALSRAYKSKLELKSKPSSYTPRILTYTQQLNLSNYS